MTMQEAVIKNIDTDYSYQLAKRMEQFRSNEKLGYRPAGSKAEFLTGEMLKDEMQNLDCRMYVKMRLPWMAGSLKMRSLRLKRKREKGIPHCSGHIRQIL